MERDSFIFYKSFYEASTYLSNEDKGKLFDMICQYGLYWKEMEWDWPSKWMFMLIKPQLDANNKRYENWCKGGEYWKLGWRPKKDWENSQKPQTNPTQTPNDNVNVNVNENNKSQKCDDNDRNEKSGVDDKPHLLQDYSFLNDFYNMENKTVAYQFKKNKGYLEKEKYKVDELIRIDGYTKEQIEQMLSYIKNDVFRSDKILSIEKLRRKSPQTWVPYHIMMQEKMKKKWWDKPNTLVYH